MATFDFIKATASGDLPGTVAVSNTSLPPLSKGTPLSTYMSPASTALYPSSDVTSYITTTTTPSYSGQKGYLYNASPARFNIGGKLVDTSGYGLNTILPSSSPYNNSSWSLESYVSGTDVTFQVFAYGDSDYRVFVDDMPLTGAWQHFPNTANVYFIKVQFASSRTRKIRVFLSANAGFAQALTPSTGDIWPAENRYKVAVIGDSYVQGTGSTNEGTITAGTIANEIAIRTGWQAWNLGEGGTGYQNAAGQQSPGPNGIDIYGAANRINALKAIPTPDLVIVYGGGNDGDHTQWPLATTIANANACWTAIRTALPNTPIVISGTESGAFTSINADMDALNVALKAAALAHPAIAGYVDQRSPKWVTGTGRDGAPVGDGSADIFISSDAVHPTHAGFGYTAERLVKEMMNIRV